MRKESLLTSILVALTLAAGCGGQVDPETHKKEVLFSFLSGATMFGGSNTITIKVVNARKNRSTPSHVDKDQYIYMQPNQPFLTPVKKKDMLSAQKTVCLDTAYADTVETVSGNAVYTFTASRASSIRLYFSIGKSIPETTIVHSPTDTDMHNVRFDWVELTLDGSSTACANLTSLEQLGICMTLRARNGSDDAHASTLGWSKSFNDIVTETKVSNASAVKYNDDDPAKICRIKGASKYPDDWPAANMISTLIGKSIIMTGAFNGSDLTPDHGKAGFRFTGTFASPGGIPQIELSGNFYESSTPLPATMKIVGLSPAAVYAADVMQCSEISHTGGGYTNDQSAKENDRWAKLFALLVGGINTGMWKVEPNNLRWSSAIAYPNGDTCNPYSRMIREYSNSYGDPYSDLTEKVLLNLFETRDGKTVDTLVITLLDDAETGDHSDREVKTHMDKAFLQLSIPPPNLLKLTQIDFEQSGSIVGSDVIEASNDGIAAQFPCGIVFGQPVKMIFHFSDYTHPILPSITVTLPEDVFAAPDPAKISIPAGHPGWVATGGLCSWLPINYTGPFVNLQFSGDLKAGNYQQ